MSVLQDHFEPRVKEIDVYFNFLSNLLTEQAELYFPKKAKSKFKAFDPELSKILRANAFILLYNLIESSIKLAIDELYESINIEGPKYSAVTDEWKRKWIEINYKDFKTQEYTTERIFSVLLNLENDPINLPTSSAKISGNVDAQKIREFAKEYGFADKTHHLSKKGVKLHIVKKNRNWLAHGSKSFTEVGKDYTIQDVLETKKEVIIYVRGILKNIDGLVINKKYLTQSIT